jgi:hypothetical protein
VRLILTLVCLAAFTPPFAATAADLPWTFFQRDVYVDGSIDRAALVYRSADRLRTMVVSDRLQWLVILDEERLTVGEAPRRELRTSDDLTRAGFGEGRLRAGGRVTRTAGGVLAFGSGSTNVVVAPHRSAAGPLEPAALARDYPVWGALRDTFSPDAASVAALHAVDTPVDVTIVFATWCGDSRREVPRVLRAIEDASNTNLRVSLVGLGPDFEPLDFVQDRRVINVPTIIVERDGAELGRIVESPASKSVEEDLAAILSGVPGAHDGRWERDHRIASGRYTLAFDDGRAGSETWRLFSTRDGGKLAHSVIDDGALVREVWHRVDAEGKTTFVEVTDRAGHMLRRTRYRLRDGELRASSRGNDSGIVDQALALPRDCSFLTGAVATAGWSCAMPDSATAGSSVRYALPLESTRALGTTRSVRLDRVEDVAETRAGIPVHVRRVRASDHTTTTDLWIDAALGIPLRLDGDGVRAELVSLELG